ncbi:hypothetical protein M5K25_005836 [Dendrobium thyrsiflorum]|uniref:Uncharacterized protein n=1 Tax=Dendrobium thyrsiflorum TaxID=117978 RepID=A0ABD0VAR4_DENTH
MEHSEPAPDILYIYGVRCLREVEFVIEKWEEKNLIALMIDDNTTHDHISPNLCHQTTVFLTIVTHRLWSFQSPDNGLSDHCRPPTMTTVFLTSIACQLRSFRPPSPKNGLYDLRRSPTTVVPTTISRLRSFRPPSLSDYGPANDDWQSNIQRFSLRNKNNAPNKEMHESRGKIKLETFKIKIGTIRFQQTYSQIERLGITNPMTPKSTQSKPKLNEFKSSTQSTVGRSKRRIERLDETNPTSPRTLNSDITKSVKCLVNSPRSKGSTSAVHPNHSNLLLISHIFISHATLENL